jgi:hypothetical protein
MADTTEVSLLSQHGTFIEVCNLFYTIAFSGNKIYKSHSPKLEELKYFLHFVKVPVIFLLRMTGPQD